MREHDQLLEWGRVDDVDLALGIRRFDVDDRDALLLRNRHDLVGRLLIGIPDVDPNAGAREHGTASRFGTRNGGEQPGREGGETEQEEDAAAGAAAARRMG